MRTLPSPEMLHTRKIRRRKTGFQRMDGDIGIQMDAKERSEATPCGNNPSPQGLSIAGSGCRKQLFAALFDSPRSPSRSPPDRSNYDGVTM